MSICEMANSSYFRIPGNSSLYVVFLIIIQKYKNSVNIVENQIIYVAFKYIRRRKPEDKEFIQKNKKGCDFGWGCLGAWAHFIVDFCWCFTRAF